MKKILTIILGIILLCSLGLNVYLLKKNSDMNSNLESSETTITELTSDLTESKNKVAELEGKISELEKSIETFNYQQGTIEGYEFTEEDTEDVVDKSELNDIGNESYNGEEEITEAPEEPTVETPSTDEGTPYTLTESDKETLRALGATEDEINAVKTQEQFDALLAILFNRSVGNPGGSSGGSGGSGGGGNSGGDSGSSGGSGYEDGNTGLPAFELPPNDGSLPGYM